MCERVLLGGIAVAVLLIAWWLYARVLTEPEPVSQPVRFVVVVPLEYFPARLVYEAEAKAVRVEPDLRPSL